MSRVRGSRRSERGASVGAFYRERAPDPELRPFVECFWTIRSHERLREVRLNRVVPDGCTDVIVDLGDPGTSGSESMRRTRCYFVGAMSRPLLVPLEGTVDLVGVRFRPGVGGAMLRMPMSELTDRSVPLDDVLPDTPAAETEESLAVEPLDGRPAALGTLTRRWLAAADPVPPELRAAVRRIQRTRGAVGVSELARWVGLSVRQLERLFARFAGTPPKTVCRIVRFRAAWRRLHLDPSMGLGPLAHRFGYADQAHMTREFREFAGVPPGRSRREGRDVASVQDGSPPGP